MRVIFHLGMHKTGSSSIQDSFYHSYDKLKEHGILYPKSIAQTNDGFGKRHAPLIYKYMKNIETQPVPRVLIDEIENSQCHTVILSYEAWSSINNFHHLNRCVQFFREENVNEITGYIYMDNVSRFAVNFYRQHTFHHGNKEPFGVFIKKKKSIFDYVLIVRVLRGIFGENLHVFNYTNIRNVVEHFIDASGVVTLSHEEMERRSNIGVGGALKVETVRIGAELGLNKKECARALNSNAKYLHELEKDTVLTERFSGDLLYPLRSDVTDFSIVANWDREESENILTPEVIVGENVGTLGPSISKILANEQCIS